MRNNFFLILFTGIFLLGGCVERQEPDFYSCISDSDCISVKSGCCGCNAGGFAAAINRKSEGEWRDKLSGDCREIACPAVESDHPSCFQEPGCVEGKCVLKSPGGVTVSTDKSVYGLGTEINATLGYEGEIYQWDRYAWSIQRWEDGSWITIQRTGDPHFFCANMPECKDVGLGEIRECPQLVLCEAPCWEQVRSAKLMWDQSYNVEQKEFQCRFIQRLSGGKVSSGEVVNRTCAIFDQIPPGKYKIRFEYTLTPDPDNRCSRDVDIKYAEKELTVIEGGVDATPVDKGSCEALGGRWGGIGLSPEESCNLPTSDADRECSGSGECEGSCIARLSEEDWDRAVNGVVYTKGKCSAWKITVGCQAFVEDGRVEGILCVD